MKQIENKNFKKFGAKKVDYIFSYNLYKLFPEASVQGSEKMTDDMAKQLDGFRVKLAVNTAVSAFIKGTMVPPQWCYPVKYSYERRCEEFIKRQRWNRCSHSGRRVIIG